MNEVFRKSMEVGYLFAKECKDIESTSDWLANEECYAFAKITIDHAEDENCDIETAFHKYMNVIINIVNTFAILKGDDIPLTFGPMWSDYTRGFLAGEIIGFPTEENLLKVAEAEKIWNEDDGKFGYYQEVLELVVDLGL